MNTKPTVIEGCVASYDDNGSTFCPASPGVADIPASLVIGDKAVPLSVVVELAPYIQHKPQCDYELPFSPAMPCSCGLDQLKETVAKDFNITL